MNTVHQLKPAVKFDDFWQAYWRKVDKPLARARWDAITNGGLATRNLDRDSGEFVPVTLKATPDEIMAGLKRYNKQIYTDKTEIRFVKHPATWLNRGGWME